MAALLPAQTFVETAVAAAGGSAAAVAGRKVSDGFDTVMSKVADIGKQASRAGAERKGRALPAMPGVPSARGNVRLPEPARQPVRYTAPSRAPVGKYASVVRPREVIAPPPIVPEPYVPPSHQPEVTAADLRQLSSGTTREELFDRMGKPAARITMADDRGLVEVYSFRNSSGRVGSVQVINGSVADVKVTQ